MIYETYGEEFMNFITELNNILSLHELVALDIL